MEWLRNACSSCLIRGVSIFAIVCRAQLEILFVPTFDVSVTALYPSLSRTSPGRSETFTLFIPAQRKMKMKSFAFVVTVTFVYVRVPIWGTSKVGSLAPVAQKG